ncbi:MAG: hypothetical protein M3R58_10630 [Pseudomonadota bacterium]|nr:hypothetical protein [Pseudomonadota bacterium]
MKKPRPVFISSLKPLAKSLPDDISRSIGRTVARHSYLEWILGEVLYSLLEISIKQGRAVVNRPVPRQYAAAIEGLFKFHKLESPFKFERLARSLERADAARDTLVQSVFMRDADRKDSPVFLVRGSWSLGLDLETVRRDAWPDTPEVTAALLAGLREDVEDAVGRAETLRALTDKLLRRLHEHRRTNPRLNRRGK